MHKSFANRLGYHTIDYGFSCGRHWVEIDGKVICQTEGDDLYLADADVAAIARLIFGPNCWDGDR
jgi:predicted amidohydrolase